VGFGLPGIRERVRLLDGRIDILDGGGTFTVDAVLPTSSEPRCYPSPAAHVDGGKEAGTAAVQEGDTAIGSTQTERRTHRRQVTVAAILPIAMTLIAAGALFATNAITVARSGMEPQTFDQLRLGQQRSELTKVLPVSHISDAPPTFEEPARPNGATCEFFRPTTNPFVIGSESLFRLCFAAGELVSKDVIS
jgi:hypothetical protein